METPEPELFVTIRGRYKEYAQAVEALENEENQDRSKHFAQAKGAWKLIQEQWDSMAEEEEGEEVDVEVVLRDGKLRLTKMVRIAARPTVQNMTERVEKAFNMKVELLFHQPRDVAPSPLAKSPRQPAPPLSLCSHNGHGHLYAYMMDSPQATSAPRGKWETQAKTPKAKTPRPPPKTVNEPKEEATAEEADTGAEGSQEEWKRKVQEQYDLYCRPWKIPPPKLSGDMLVPLTDPDLYKFFRISRRIWKKNKVFTKVVVPKPMQLICRPLYTGSFIEPVKLKKKEVPEVLQSNEERIKQQESEYKRLKAESDKLQPLMGAFHSIDHTKKGKPKRPQPMQPPGAKSLAAEVDDIIKKVTPAAPQGKVLTQQGLEEMLDKQIRLALLRKTDFQQKKEKLKEKEWEWTKKKLSTEQYENLQNRLIAITMERKKAFDKKREKIVDKMLNEGKLPTKKLKNDEWEELIKRQTEVEFKKREAAMKTRVKKLDAERPMNLVVLKNPAEYDQAASVQRLAVDSAAEKMTKREQLKATLNPEPPHKRLTQSQQDEMAARLSVKAS
uniref:Uncharacterized protein n=1 Tax=Eutreptiella gymnastica TaxID=73025 RepID=A0A7S1J1E2_9EUGL|mmetsp:Transcript_5898/g.10653  ORF Transcript_5898/g.10653 Transcript_5898/m.10653 type:complete len:556 (+) Transcript_5898:66-1733(+)